MKSCDNPYLVRFSTGPPTGPIYNKPEDNSIHGPDVGEQDTIGMIKTTQWKFEQLKDARNYVKEALSDKNHTHHQYFLEEFSILSNNIEVLESRKVNEEVIRKFKNDFKELISDCRNVYDFGYIYS